MLALKITKFPDQLQNINNFITFLVRIQIQEIQFLYSSDIKQTRKIKFVSNEKCKIIFLNIGTINIY